MAKIHDVAAYVLSSFDAPISTMKLQKLVYLAQGWSLALLDEPLYDEKHEAWANGPVSRELFREHRRMYSVSRWPSGDADALEFLDQVIVDAVVANYGALSGSELSDLTHVQGTPWAKARLKAGAEPGASSTAELSIEDMREHFKTILKPTPL